MDLHILLSASAWLTALGIFALRICDMSCDTLRVIFVVRGRKKEAWPLGFIGSLIFVIVIGAVLTNLNNPLNVVGYAAGFATGNIVGMWLEQLLAIGNIRLTIISSALGQNIASNLRADGFAVTEMSAKGRDGVVQVLNCSVLRKQMERAEKIIMESDPSAFITAEDVKPIQRGFWHTSRIVR